MAHDAPKLRNYTFSHPPDKFEIWWDKVEQQHRLSDGSLRKYTKGFLFRFSFGWSKNWLNEDDYSNICIIYNETSALALFPRPDTYPSASFTVQLTNDFNLKPWKDFLEQSGSQGYEGTIEGEGLYMTATCTTIT